MYEIKSRKELISEIALALQTNYDEGCFYLNLTTQEVGFHAPASFVGEDCIWPHMGDEVIRIDPLESWESFRSMVDFADGQSPKNADKLYRALNGSRPFARFKAAVDILDLLKEWYAFKDKWFEERAEEWLHENGVDFLDGKIVAKGNTPIFDGEDYEDWDEDEDWEEEDNSKKEDESDDKQ